MYQLIKINEFQSGVCTSEHTYFFCPQIKRANKIEPYIRTDSDSKKKGEMLLAIIDL